MGRHVPGLLQTISGCAGAWDEGLALAASRPATVTQTQALGADEGAPLVSSSCPSLLSFTGDKRVGMKTAPWGPHKKLKSAAYKLHYFLM